MNKEIRMRASEQKEALKSIYFGGGTPSVLSPEEFISLYKEIKQGFDIKNVDEVTLECNPEDLIDAKLEAWRSQGVNRLSIGNQSFQDQLLKTINRQHTSKMTIDGITKARSFGFDSISIDVITGLPGLNTDMLQEDLELLMSLEPEHVSAYQLSVEEKTTLAHQLKKGEIKLASEEEINQQFLQVDSFLSSRGYSHYEISNYARPGFIAKHNSSYWESDSYVGIGPGAHSFSANKRRWNVSNNQLYVKHIESGEPWYEEESLSEKDRFNEMIMISLRTKKGLDIAHLETSFPEIYSSSIEEEIAKWIANKWAIKTGSVVQLSLEGWLISDSLASDIFVI
jgi:oxygen-independent coproporphyrinogen-3 oxidase